MFAQGRFNTNTVVANLIIINVLVFLASYVLGNTEVIICEQYVRLMPTAFYHGGLFIPTSDLFKPWQFVTNIFLHSGFMHILFNMYALWMFGSVLENVWGAKRFLIYYLSCGVLASVCVSIVNMYMLRNASPDLICEMQYIPTVGASGAVFGLLLGFGMLFPNHEMMLLFFPIPIKAKYLVTGYGLIELYSGIAQRPGDNVSHFAHLGGMLIGFILIKLWTKDRNNFY